MGSLGPVVWTPATGERKLMAMDSFATHRGVVAGRWWAAPTEGVVELADTATGLRWGAFRAHPGYVAALAARGNSLATLGNDGTLALWRLPEPGPVPPRVEGLPTGAIGRLTRPGSYCGYSPPVPWEESEPTGADHPPTCAWLRPARPTEAREFADVIACRETLGSQVPLDEYSTLCHAYSHVLMTVEPRERGDEDIVLVRGDEVIRRWTKPLRGSFGGERAVAADEQRMAARVGV
jgi:hypothetical protein